VVTNLLSRNFYKVDTGRGGAMQSEGGDKRLDGPSLFEPYSKNKKLTYRPVDD
jgi:hypothetical protein